MQLTLIQDFSNPLVRPYLHFYPEIPNGAITEIWHAEKWRKDLDSANLAPMYDDLHGKHYYINELARLKNRDFVIPMRWVKWRGRVHADVFRVTFDEEVRNTNHLLGSRLIDGSLMLVSMTTIPFSFPPSILSTTFLIFRTWR
jgi:hypothetical protein